MWWRRQCNCDIFIWVAVYCEVAVCFIDRNYMNLWFNQNSSFAGFPAMKRSCAITFKIIFNYFAMTIVFARIWCTKRGFYKKCNKLDRSFTVQKMKFSINDFFSKCDQILKLSCTEEILNGKLHFLCSLPFIFF